MAKCPKCDLDNNDGVDICESCGESIDGAQPEKSSAKKAPVDLLAIVTDALAHYWPMWVAGILFLVMQWEFPLFDWWKSWNKDHSYYSHGPLVPVITLAMVWFNRKRLAVTKANPSWWGLLLILVSVPLFIFGRWTGSGNVCGITFLLFLIGALLMFTGRRMTWLLLFPVLYLIFMIPASATVLDSVTFKIQLASTIVAGKMLSLTGYDVTQTGSTITGGGLPGPLQVGTACSGFRMLISLLTFTAFFVYMLRTPLWKKLALMAFDFPLSLFVNSIRIASIGYVGIWTGSSQTMMKFHDTGAMIFELVLSFAILFGVARLIGARDFGIPDPVIGSTPTASLTARRVIGMNAAGFAVIGIFALMSVLNVVVRPLDTSAKGSLDKPDFPRAFGYWVSQDVQLDEIVAQELKTADMIQRIYTYTMDQVPQVQVMIQAAADTDAFHDPHSCLPGGGNNIVDERIINLKFTKPKPMVARATLLRSAADNGMEFLLIYWYRTGTETYPTTANVRWKMRLAQVRDIKDLLLHRATNEEVRERTLKRQTYCYRFSSPVAIDPQTDTAALEKFVRDFVANSRHFALTSGQ